MGKIKMTANIIRQEMIATDIYSMIIEAKDIAKEAKPGQFVDLYSADGSKLLPRPISLCEIDKEAGTLRLVYRNGKGNICYVDSTGNGTTGYTWGTPVSTGVSNCSSVAPKSINNSKTSSTTS